MGGGNTSPTSEIASAMSCCKYTTATLAGGKGVDTTARISYVRTLAVRPELRRWEARVYLACPSGPDMTVVLMQRPFVVSDA